MDLLSLSIDFVSLCFLGGIALFALGFTALMISKKKSWKRIGWIIIGIGLIMLIYACYNFYFGIDRIISNPSPD
jgi:hypothetical protein